ncbi:tetratricopeptide repeat protein [Segatella oris]|jgi:putative tetratricopeptide repeat-containing domain protein|uniref:Tetratricopeptide repeat n=1 Tax=Segatella oris TaxID=28135 RepID=A0A3S4TDM9_9BACT|nr:hypothetical protein [Segatella oris]OFP29589.1 hypothetical protein HMPREF2992_12455 [Prevotella sp. HMSC069G02]VEH14697.1 Tetratricopeptide repeat [Segatella oris]
MNELSVELYDSIMHEMEQGDNASENEFLKSALKHYKRALVLLPFPKTDWEIALHVYTALGDCCFNLEDYSSANSYYNEALLCPDAVEYGYVWLGLGQSFYELGNMEKAKDALMSAYMLEGKEIFEDVDEKYFSIIKDNM